MQSQDQGGRRLEPPGQAVPVEPPPTVGLPAARPRVEEGPEWRLIGPPEAAGPPAAEFHQVTLAAPSSPPPASPPPPPPPPPLTGPAHRPLVTLPWGIALVASLLALAGAAISTALRREVRALESASQRPPDNAELASSADEQARRAQLLARDLADLERVQAELGRNLEQERGRMRALEANLAAQDEQRAAATRELETALQAAESLERDLAGERTRSAALALDARKASQQRDELTRALEEERRTSALREEALRKSSGTEGRCADGFDRVLSRIEAGSGAAACALLEQLERQGTFAPASGDGSRFLAALALAAAALEEAQGQRSTNGAAGARALLAGRARLDEALSQRAAFAREAQEWLAVGGSTQERLARADRALAELTERLGSALSDVETLHRQDWAWILERGVRQDPELSLQHEGTFGCAHAADLAAGYASALRSQCERAGRLDLELLARADELPEWGWRALSLLPHARSAADLDILWSWYAQRWYLAGPQEDEPFDWTGLEMPPVGGPCADWRSVLRLSIELLDPGSGWPPPPGQASVYRLEGDSRARWRVDRSEPSGGGREGAPSWRLVRTHFDARGVPLGASSAVQIERAGRRFRYTGSDAILVDLAHSGGEVHVAPFPELPIDVPPAGTGISAGEARAWSERLASAAGPCLVQTHGPWTRWFRPGLGLVLESRSTPQGEVRIELAAVWSP